MRAGRRLSAVVVSVVLGGTLAACGRATARTASGRTQSPSCPSGTPTVTAHGQGITQGPPDLLTLSIGVATEASTAAAALRDNSTQANALVAQLHQDGVAASDLQTSGLSIQATYTGSSPVITGYSVNNTVTARIHDITKAGALIDDAARAAGNAIRVNSVSFSIQNDASLSAQARADAVHQARARALAMASGAGMKIGPLCSLTDDSSTQPQPQFFSAGGSSASLSAPPIEAGSQLISADVTAVYQIRP